MTAQPSLNLNQLTLQSVLGQLALGLNGAPALTIQAVVSATGSPSLSPGQAVKFDTTITTNPTGLPPIVACAANAYADGYIVYDVKLGGTLTAGTILQVLLQGAMWMLVEGTTVDSGSVLEDGADVGSMEPFATTGNYPRGVSLDYATSGQLFRAFLTPFTIKSAQASSHA